MKLILSFAGVVLLSAPAFAISEKNYAHDFDSIIMPFYQSAGVTGEFAGVGGIKISYRKFEVSNEKGAIVFSPGRGESYLRYPELEYDLTQAGYSVYVLDHRSQGFSGRLAPDPQVVTTEGYDHYVTDFTTFIDTVVNAVPHAHRYLLTNSMGGPIGALYLARNPRTFERAVLSVPMFEINTHGFPEGIAMELSRVEAALGNGNQFAKLGGEKPYDFNHHSDCGSADGLQVRSCKIEELVTANPLTASGGSSYRWVYESLMTTRKIRGTIGSRIKIPLLVFQAGQDQVVKPGGQNTFCHQAAHCEMMIFAQASHGVLCERDEIRAPAVRAIIEFFGSSNIEKLANGQ